MGKKIARFIGMSKPNETVKGMHPATKGRGQPKTKPTYVG